MNSGTFGTAKVAADLLESPQEPNTLVGGPASGNPDVPEGRASVIADETSQSLRFFGDGAEGDFSISTTTFTGGPFTSGGLVRNAFINNLTLTGSGRISLGGYVCLICGTLDLRYVNSTGGIAMIGNAGVNATTQTGASSSSASAGSIYGGSVGSGTGGTGTTTNGGNASATTSALCVSPGVPGVGGVGGQGASGTGGTGSTSVNQNQSIVGTGANYRTPVVVPYTINGITNAAISGIFGGLCGGSGGAGGGDSTNSGRGGGSGSEGGRTLYILARTIARSAAAPASTIRSYGRTGGNGASASSGNIGGGGGGGGGVGGFVYIAYENLIGDPCVNMIDVSGGNGGNGGNGFGSGLGGRGGQGGQAGCVYIANLKTGMISYTCTSGATVSTPSVPGTATGSSGSSGETLRVTL